MSYNIRVKSELATAFTKLTGLTMNIDELIENASSQTEREELYIRLIWALPDGNVDELSDEAAELKTFIIDKLQDPEVLDISVDDNFEAAIANLKELTEANKQYEETIAPCDEDVKKFYVDDYQILLDAKAQTYSQLIVANRTNDADGIDAAAAKFAELTASVTDLQQTVLQAQLAKNAKSEDVNPGGDESDDSADSTDEVADSPVNATLLDPEYSNN